MKTPKGCEWKTVIGRPVLIRTKDGVICGGKVPKEWHGKRLQDRPWENTPAPFNPREYVKEKEYTIANGNRFVRIKHKPTGKIHDVLIRKGHDGSYLHSLDEAKKIAHEHLNK